MIARSNQILFMLICLCWVASCGQKSKITPSIEAKTTAQEYGDGEHIIRTVVMPLSDQMIEKYDSPISRMNFLAGGFAKLFMDMGAKMGMGRTQMSLIQPVPEIPRDFIRSAVLKRVFFYIEPTNGDRQPNWFQRVFRGKSAVDFKFLNKLAVKVSPHEVQNVNTWNPHYEVRDIRNGEYTPLQTLFEEDDVYRTVKDPEKIKDLVIVKYASKDRQKFLKDSQLDNVFIMNTSRPIKLKRYLENHPKFKNYFNSIHVLHGKKKKNHPKNVPVPGTLLVELVKGRVIEEGFRVQLADDAAELEKIGVDIIEQCSEYTCMDLLLPEVDIIPLISKGNAIKIDTFMDAKKVPESFQLKGFIEFEIKLKLSF